MTKSLFNYRSFFTNSNPGDFFVCLNFKFGLQIHQKISYFIRCLMIKTLTLILRQEYLSRIKDGLRAALKSQHGSCAVKVFTRFHANCLILRNHWSVQQLKVESSDCQTAPSPKASSCESQQPAWRPKTTQRVTCRFRSSFVFAVRRAFKNVNRLFSRHEINASLSGCLSAVVYRVFSMFDQCSGTWRECRNC